MAKVSPLPHSSARMTDTPQSTPTQLRLWQQNLNKSRSAQEGLINLDIQNNYDIILLQEPYINSFSNTKAMREGGIPNIPLGS